MSPRYEGAVAASFASRRGECKRRYTATTGPDRGRHRRPRLEGAGLSAATDSRSSRRRRPFSWARLANET
jgi:hypothetical protein